MKRWRGIRAVSFDVGGTLIDPWPSVGGVYAAVASEVGLPQFDPALLNAQFASAWRTKENFDYSRRAWAELVVNTFGGSSAQFGLTTPLFERLYARFAEAAVWKIYDDVRPALAMLKGRGLRIAAVSNWDDRLRRLLNALELDSLFDSIHVSAEGGFHKPAPEIFLNAANALGVSPSAVLHVGDSAFEDVRGARNAGMHAILIKRGKAGERAGEVRSLLELPGLLESQRPCE